MYGYWFGFILVLKEKSLPTRFNNDNSQLLQRRSPPVDKKPPYVIL